MFGFKFIRFEKLNKDYNIKIEESIIEMIGNFKMTPLEIGNLILEELYNKIDERWKFFLMIERKIREATLAIFCF